MRVILDNARWYEYNGIYAIGYAVTDDGRYIHGHSFCVYLYERRDRIVESIKSIDGLFSIVIEDMDDIYYIATDISRTYNIFYTKAIITDNPQRLIEYPISKQAKSHLLSMNSVLTGETLLEGVCQVRGGHIIVMKNGEINDICCHNLLGSLKRDITEEEVSCCIRYIFENLGKTLKREDGSQRQAVLALSGGYDSRIVAERLINQLHHTNVLFYTMGCMDLSEQGIAIQVAKELGVECYHIDFKDIQIEDALNEEFCEAVQYVGALSSFCYIADYYAIKHMRSQGLIDEDAIFIAGHIGDTWGGSTIRKWRIKPNNKYHSIVAKIMLSEYGGYSLFHNEARRKIQKIIKEATKEESNALQIAMQFSIENMSSNGCGTESRYYSFWGYDIRLPLYSKEIMKLASQMREDSLINNILYNKTLENKFFKPANINIEKILSSRTAFKIQHIKNFIKVFIPRSIKVKYKKLGVNLLMEGYLTFKIRQWLLERGTIKHDDDFMSYNELMNLYYTSLLEEKGYRSR